ncbi:MAG: hypothetical protein GY854_14245 [Deltaproteobacteria bacterium]|nr:hypothetical protein [Deltaproteobacteria bacterium]
MVVSFELGFEADLALDIIQIGNHEFGLYRATGSYCTESPVACFNPDGVSEDGTVFYDLAPGEYYLVVEGHDSTSADTAVIIMYITGEICGNDVRDPGEECDDGNTEPDDGCNPICQIEPQECVVDENLGVLEPGEQIKQTIDMTVAGDEWATICSESGQDYVFSFATYQSGNILVQMTQQGNHAVGLYPEGNVYNYLCIAEGLHGACVGKGPDMSAYVGFMGRPAGTYYVIVEAIQYETAGTVDLTIYFSGCIKDNDLGTLLPSSSGGGPVPFNAITTAGINAYEAGCGGESGNEIVIGFSLDQQRNVTLEWSNQVGDHVFGIFEDRGGSCDSSQVDCYDPFGATDGSITFNRIAAGNYVLIVDAYDPGAEGSIDLVLSVE